MIDLHSHVLYGVDDGPEKLAGSLAICEAAASDGVTVLAATPHVRRDYPTPPELMEHRLAEVAAAAGETIRLVPGGELDLAELRRPLDELRRFALAGNPEYLLVETPYYGWPLELPGVLFDLRLGGIVPVLAHPERNGEVQLRPDVLEPLVAGGCLVQLTAASVDGRLGRGARACAARLLELGLAHLIASDAHEPSVRAVGMSSAVETVGDELGAWLAEDVPRAIVEGTPLPPRPARRRPRLRFRR